MTSRSAERAKASFRKANSGDRGKDPWGMMRVGISLGGEIDREDYGLTWNQALEAGGVLVAKKVKIQIEAQLVDKRTHSGWPSSSGRTRTATRRGAQTALIASVARSFELSARYSLSSRPDKPP